MTKRYLNELTYSVIGAAIEVHKALGPGLLESVYHKIFKYKLSIRKLNHKSETVLPVSFKGVKIDVDFRCDFFIEECLVVELKAVNSLIPIIT